MEAGPLLANVIKNMIRRTETSCIRCYALLALGLLGWSQLASAQSGVVVGLGNNQYGQLGSEIPTLVRSPIELVNGGITQVVGAGYGTLLLRDDGVVLASGHNINDRLLDSGDDDWRYLSPIEAWRCKYHHLRPSRFVGLCQSHRV